MLANGTVVRGQYQIVRLLGQGGMSNIYLCSRVGQAAADLVLKEMTVSYRDAQDQKRAEELFLREAAIMQKLHHRHLPRVYDQFIEGKQHYFVMDYVEGEDLGRVILRHPQGFEEAQVLRWALELSTVLYYLHCQNPPVIFRDLKPSNVMISRGSVKLIDFGIARHFDPFKKKDTMRIGSPGYAPPEQYSGQTDQRSDVYSLGVTMHHLLTGHDPSEAQAAFQLPPVRRINPRVSATTEAIVARATAIDPAQRYKTALEMKRAIQAVLGVASVPLPAAPASFKPLSGGATPASPAAAASPPAAAARPSPGAAAAS